MTENSSSHSRRPTVVSLFTGAGGLDLGLEQAGFETVLCFERDEDCLATLAANRPKWMELTSKLPEDKKGDLSCYGNAKAFADVKADLGLTDVGLVVGGAPCQPFSNIGKKQGTSSPDGQLFEAFLHAVDGFRPRGFIFENVSAIRQARHREVEERIAVCAKKLGYIVTVGIINAADYGVPQNRRRMFAVGVRVDLANGVEPSLPDATHGPGLKPHVSVRDAFELLETAVLDKSLTLGMKPSEKMVERFEHIKPGTRDNFARLPDHLRPPCWKTGRHQGADTFGRLLWDQPSVTIRTGAFHPMKGRYIHPKEHRGLNTGELAVLQGFPVKGKARWLFKTNSGKPTLSSVARQIGNAVPPPLAKAIGRCLLGQIGAKPSRVINSGLRSVRQEAGA